MLTDRTLNGNEPQAAETLYGRWGKKHKVKACPTCHRHIEKNGGCVQHAWLFVRLN